jgi:hypothetical protein
LEIFDRVRAGVDELPVPALEGKEAGLIAAAAGSTSIDDDDPIVVARALDAIAERTGNRAFPRSSSAAACAGGAALDHRYKRGGTFSVTGEP